MNVMLSDKVICETNINESCKRKGNVRADLVATLTETLKRWERNYRSRRQLLSLDAGQLKDIGLSRADALKEGRLPFWK